MVVASHRKRVSVLLDRWLHDAVAELARRDRRSVSKYVGLLVEADVMRKLGTVEYVRRKNNAK